jgi:hypothetical protein
MVVQKSICLVTASYLYNIFKKTFTIIIYNFIENEVYDYVTVTENEV